MSEKSLEENEIPKFARVVEVIPTREQQYIDPARQYAHNDLYPSSEVVVIEIQDKKVLVRDDTGEFWVPKNKLEF